MIRKEYNPMLRTEIGDNWHPKYLPYFAMAMMGLIFITNILNLKFIDVAGFSIIASQIVYVFSLVLADMMTEVYGYKRVRKLLYVGLGILCLYAACLQITVMLPPAKDYQNDEAFKAIFSQTPRIVAASIIAYFFTELTASFVMSKLKVFWKAERFYWRAVISVGIAQIVNGITFFSIAFLGVMTLPTIVSAASFAWLCVMICEFVVLPFTKTITWKIKHLEGVEHFDSDPNGSRS